MVEVNGSTLGTVRLCYPNLCLEEADAQHQDTKLRAFVYDF